MRLIDADALADALFEKRWRYRQEVISSVQTGKGREANEC